jgi:uncharacterized peroxidase-related enzyme
MTWIKTVSPEAARGDLDDVHGALDEIYRAIAAARGGVAEVHRAQSLNPRALRAHLDLYRAVVFQRSSLSRVARERIAVVVSAATRCDYCVAHHSEALRRLGDDPSIIEALGRGELPERLGGADLALLTWARQGALDPARASEADVQALRAQRFDDRAILGSALTIAYFSFVNRLTLLLGVGLEADYVKTCGDEVIP